MDLWNLVPVRWQSHLEHVRPRIEVISRELERLESEGVETLPVRSQIFSALRVPPEEIRVVILGQDPYPNARHAMGLCFSVPAGTSPLPPSLRNILTELEADVGDSVATSGNLEPWVDQGVLLLNRVLTVESGRTDSHKKVGWQEVTEAIVETVVRVNPAVVAVLWGRAAIEMRGLFRAGCVVESVHPSPLSAYRGFFGSKPFSTVNRILSGSDLAEIRW